MHPRLSTVNETDIFFYTSESAMNACPTYKARFIQRFSDWLKARYGTQEALQRAWQGLYPNKPQHVVLLLAWFSVSPVRVVVGTLY